MLFLVNFPISCYWPKYISLILEMPLPSWGFVWILLDALIAIFNLCTPWPRALLVSLALFSSPSLMLSMMISVSLVKLYTIMVILPLPKFLTSHTAFFFTNILMHPFSLFPFFFSTKKSLVRPWATIFFSDYSLPPLTSPAFWDKLWYSTQHFLICFISLFCEQVAPLLLYVDS